MVDSQAVLDSKTKKADPAWVSGFFSGYPSQVGLMETVKGHIPTLIITHRGFRRSGASCTRSSRHRLAQQPIDLTKDEERKKRAFQWHGGQLGSMLQLTLLVV